MEGVIKDIRKALMKGKLYLSDHTKLRMNQRGYTKSDIARALLNGMVFEIQQHSKGVRYVITGEDDSLNPIVVVIQKTNRYDIITVMPPYDQSRFHHVI